MIEFTIKAENEDTKNAFLSFQNNYKDSIAEFMNLLMKNSGQVADVMLKIGEDETLEIYQMAPDKGFVMADTKVTRVAEDGTTTEETEVGIMNYSKVPVGEKYMLFKDGGVWVLLKDEVGVPDTKVGHFKNLNDGVTMFNSPQVLEQIKKTKEEIKKETKIIDKIKKGDANRAKMHVNK